MTEEQLPDIVYIDGPNWHLDVTRGEAYIRKSEYDRERAATIEAAVQRIEPAANADDISRAVLSVAQCSIRALHTDATRAAMDAIRREGK